MGVDRRMLAAREGGTKERRVLRTMDQRTNAIRVNVLSIWGWQAWPSSEADADVSEALPKLRTCIMPLIKKQTLVV